MKICSIKNISYFRFTGSVSNEKNCPKDEFPEYEKINIKVTQRTLVKNQPKSKEQDIDMTFCPAYGEAKNISANQNKDDQPEVPGVYETIQ